MHILDINLDILLLILNYSTDVLVLHNVLVDVLNLTNILFVNKLFFSLMSQSYKKIIYAKINFFKSYTIDKSIISLFDGYFNMTKIPYLKFSNKFVGMTQYIDNVYHYNLTHPVMFSVDTYNRLFFCFKFKLKHIDNLMMESKTVTTIFQRYTDGKQWCFGNFYKETLNYHVYFNQGDINNFKTILNGGVIQKGSCFFYLDK